MPLLSPGFLSDLEALKEMCRVAWPNLTEIYEDRVLSADPTPDYVVIRCPQVSHDYGEDSSLHTPNQRTQWSIHLVYNRVSGNSHLQKKIEMADALITQLESEANVNSRGMIPIVTAVHLSSVTPPEEQSVDSIQIDFNYFVHEQWVGGPL